MLAFSTNFSMLYGLNYTGEDLGIIIKSAYRNLTLIADNLYEFTIFICALK